MGAHCQIHHNSTLVPLDSRKKHYSECVTFVCNQNHTHTAKSSVQRAIRGAPSEEALQKKIAKQECYTELVEIILGAITVLSDAFDMTKEHKTYVEKVNRMIEFMHEKGVKPGCKTLTRETTYSDFIYTVNSTETMNSARDIANSKVKGDELIKQ